MKNEVESDYMGEGMKFEANPEGSKNRAKDTVIENRKNLAQECNRRETKGIQGYK